MNAPSLVGFKVKNETFLIKRDTLIAASVFFKDLFGLSDNEVVDAQQSVPIIKETCKVSEFRAFVKSLAIFKRDEISYSYFKETKLSASIIEKCIPLVHKYDCKGVMELCLDAIQKNGCSVLWADAVASFERYFGNDPCRVYDFNEGALRCLVLYYSCEHNRKQFKEHVSERTSAQIAGLLMDDAMASRVASKRKDATDTKFLKKCSCKRAKPATLPSANAAFS